MRTPAVHQLTFGSNTADSEKKLRELILYVVEKCGKDSRFGATKLNKILFWSDFLSFANTGEPITGVEYMRLPKGPAPRRLVPVRNALVDAGDLEVKPRVLIGGFTKTTFLAKRKPDRAVFTREQLAFVDEVIKVLRDQTAGEVSEGSHTRAWKIADDGDSIPYEAVFISDRGLVESDIESAKKLAAKLGWANRLESRRAAAGA